MPTIEERALETAVEAVGRRMQDYRVMAEENILRRSIEAHARVIAELEAFKREVSDSVEHYLDQWRYSIPSREVFACQFGSFILPKPVDPLVEAIREASVSDADSGDAERLRAALAKRGGRIVFKEVGDAD